MNILLFHFWHPFALFYLTRCLDDSMFYYCDDWQGGKFQGWGGKFPIPEGPSNFRVVSHKEMKDLKIDFKLLVLSNFTSFYKAIRDSPIQKNVDVPTIWRTWWLESKLPPGIHNGYPIIYGFYTPIKHQPWIDEYTTSITPPDPTFWDKWNGKEKVAIYSTSSWQIPQYVNSSDCKTAVGNKPICSERKLVKCCFSKPDEARLKILTRIPTIMLPPIPGAGGGTLPFKEYLNLFRKSRVYWEASRKALSYPLLESMTLGMPIVIYERRIKSPFEMVVRNGIDGYCSRDPDYVIDKILGFIDDLELARKWGMKAKERITKLTGKDKVKQTYKCAYKKAYDNWCEKS